MESRLIVIMRKFGLIGKTLKHSFSKSYFTEKFQKEGIDAQYELYELADIAGLKDLLHDPDLVGLNVTIPYKEQVLPYLNAVDPTAEAIGAVNTIRIERRGAEPFLTGFNTDFIGFTDSLKTMLKPYHQRALILGTGGASKAVRYALVQLGIEPTFVSRTPREGGLTYADLDEAVMTSHLLIVNCSPVGMFPHTDEAPDIPYDLLCDKHYLYDLVYNPLRTRFCELGEARGAAVQNGLAMLHGQAVAAWNIWNK